MEKTSAMHKTKAQLDINIKIKNLYKLRTDKVFFMFL